MTVQVLSSYIFLYSLISACNSCLELCTKDINPIQRLSWTLASKVGKYCAINNVQQFMYWINKCPLIAVTVSEMGILLLCSCGSSTLNFSDVNLVTRHYIYIKVNDSHSLLTRNIVAPTLKHTKGYDILLALIGCIYIFVVFATTSSERAGLVKCCDSFCQCFMMIIWASLNIATFIVKVKLNC